MQAKPQPTSSGYFSAQVAPINGLQGANSNPPAIRPTTPMGTAQPPQVGHSNMNNYHHNQSIRPPMSGSAVNNSQTSALRMRPAAPYLPPPNSTQQNGAWPSQQNLTPSTYAGGPLYTNSGQQHLPQPSSTNSLRASPSYNPMTNTPSQLRERTNG